jgi:putative pyruvate formate lyase activating enzyme
MRLSNTDLSARAAALHARLAACDICPHRCGVDRLAGRVGRCGVGELARIASACDHHGEEPVISGTRGSGTVFTAGCNLRCVYCQNHQISQGDLARHPERDAAALAATFLDLQARGCHNLNWVSPTHVVPQLVAGLAAAEGFRLPIVYNSNGYDAVDVLRVLDGIVDIYLPDLKYGDDGPAARYSEAPRYPDIALAAIGEMYRQSGDLALDDQGIAVRGVIVRHLVLPGNLANTRLALRRLAEEVSPTITVSLMAQYYPTHHAARHAALARTITAEEYDDALDAFAEAGLESGWSQEPPAQETYRPNFDADGHPFER